MAYCAPEATLKPKRFQFMPKHYEMSSSCKCARRLFQTHGLAAAKLLSPNVLCVRGTALVQSLVLAGQQYSWSRDI